MFGSWIDRVLFPSQVICREVDPRCLVPVDATMVEVNGGAVLIGERMIVATVEFMSEDSRQEMVA